MSLLEEKILLNVAVKKNYDFIEKLITFKKNLIQYFVEIYNNINNMRIL